MYLQSSLCIDPSQITSIGVKKPTKAFAKMLNVMTFGLTSEKEERETFTAIAILQSLNKIFRGVGVTNIVRLAKDDEDFYHDREGKTDDLREAMQTFQQAGAGGFKRVFETLRLVLEDRDNELKYLIDVNVTRVHKVGEFPIRILVNGLLTDFSAGASVTREQLVERLKPGFSSQESYDQLVDRKKQHFGSYLDRLEAEIREQMGVDEVVRDTSVRIVRPKKVARGRPEVRHDDEYDEYDEYDPFFYDYYGFDDFYFYAWLWSEMCYEYDIYSRDFTLIDEHGHAICAVGEEGFDAGSNNAMNPAEDFETPAKSDVEYFPGSDYANSIAESGVTVGSGGGGAGETASGWADSVSDAVSSDSGSSSSSSSGGSSCGGGCSSE
ncbi:MAG: hypothetical protein O7D29_08810 [Gemmatimonadetes bacterium]|nr:hypothetical protein [Gemmatimonadota bacterium]